MAWVIVSGAAQEFARYGSWCEQLAIVGVIVLLAFAIDRQFSTRGGDL